MILFDNHSQVADNMHMTERSLSKLFDYGTPIPKTLDELSVLLNKTDRDSVDQISKLQHLLFIESEQQHATDEIAMILFAIEEPVRVLVVNIIDKHAWSANLPEADWLKIKNQVQTAQDLEGNIDRVRTISDLNNQIVLLRTLPRNLVFNHRVNTPNGQPETEITVTRLALTLDNILTLLRQLESIQLSSNKPDSSLTKVFKSLIKVFDGSSSNLNQKNLLLNSIDQNIAQLPPNYQGAIRIIIESITEG